MNYQEHLSQILKRHDLGSKILEQKVIQDLWSGYGKLMCIQTDKSNFVLKLITSPTKIDHPKGFTSEFPHQRKMKSYLVEMNFYAHYNSHINKAYTPNYIAHHKDSDIQYIILEDLTKYGYVPKNSISNTEIKACIKWLASFHMNYLGKTPKDLWNIGTYWQLKTRPDEFETMDEGALKKYAKPVDLKLNESEYQTILHGDAKLGNFLFNTESVAAVDFQYTGGGVGVKDLAYFLSSIYNEKELFENESDCLDFYFNCLKDLGASPTLEKEWRELYPYAWFDFYRFLAGWSPEHYKINDYIKAQMYKVLDAIR